MQDKFGNKIVIGSELRSVQSPPGCRTITCVGIEHGIATFRKSDFSSFRLNQRSLLISDWKVVDETE